MSPTVSGRRVSHLRLGLAAAARGLVRAFNTNKTSWAGLAVFLVVCLLAILAPLIAAHDPLEQNILVPAQAALVRALDGHRLLRPGHLLAPASRRRGSRSSSACSRSASR